MARIGRADELTNQLEAACKAFLATRPYTVEERLDDNPAVRMFVVTSLHEVPVLQRIITGEIAHHLRASLDLLAYQLLLKANITDPKRLRDRAFPIIVDRDLTKPEDRKKHDALIRHKIDGIDRRVYDRIVALQPCATNREWSHLAQVQALDNTDKHRLLLAATSSIRIGGWNFRDEDGSVTTMPHQSLPPEARSTQQWVYQLNEVHRRAARYGGHPSRMVTRCGGPTVAHLEPDRPLAEATRHSESGFSGFAYLTSDGALAIAAISDDHE